jgi:hypothetical protein
LAGDIGNPYSANYEMFLNDINNKFNKIFIITGNHEYYNNYKSIYETNEYIKNICLKYKNISFLNNSHEEYEGYNFIGTTLWSKITKPEYKINDTSSIQNMTIPKYNELNKICVDYLDKSLNKLDNIVIISHHMPSNLLIADKYKSGNMSNYNEWFYCDMDQFIKKYNNKIKCWIYGHTHTPSEKIIENVICICNPIGYPHENTKVDFNKIFELK